MTAHRRTFRLPSHEDLSKEQEAALHCNLDGQHLIIGGPGTGKSIIALLRAHRHARKKSDYIVLVYTHILDRANEQLFEGNLHSCTWNKWFWEVWRDTGHDMPLIKEERDPVTGWAPYDWDTIEQIVQRLPSKDAKCPPLVIDEGQDMPPQFYETLVALGCDSFFVAADQNQQITDDRSSRQDIQDALAIASEEIMEFRENYRNSRPVARLAHAFYTGDPATPPPDLPQRRGGFKPTLYRYSEGRLDEIAERLLRFFDRKPDRLIGIIAPNNEVRRRYFEALQTTLREGGVPFDHGEPRPVTVSKMYLKPAQRKELDFGHGGIFVMNAQACKGLEFDVVVLADIDEHSIVEDDDAVKRLFYVMVSRAREIVLLFMKDGERQGIERILPTDPSILVRKEL